MTKYFVPLAIAALALPSAASANHIFDLGTPFSSRGECEAEAASIDNFDGGSLLDRFPDLFSSRGEARSFIGRAFTCEQSSSDGLWYLADHRGEVLSSDWFQRRQ